MPSASRIAHAGMPFANPMAEPVIDAAIAALPIGPAPSVLDVGCGNGEIMLRVLRRHPAGRGVGVDRDADALEDARARATGLTVRFEQRDASSLTGRFDAVISVAASHALGGCPAALVALRALAPVALYGEGFWRRPPSQEFLAALGGATAAELCDLDGLRATIDRQGFQIVAEFLAGDDDWALYEETLATNAERDASAESLRYARRIRDRRRLTDGPDTLGFALFVLAGR